MMTLPLPAAPAGTVQEQAAQQYSYLVQMAQQLNLALGQLEELEKMRRKLENQQ